MNPERDIAVLQEQMKEVTKKIDHIDEKIDSGFDRVETLFKEERELFKKELEKKADKENSWAEGAIRWVLYTVGAIILVAVLGLIGLKSK